MNEEYMQKIQALYELKRYKQVISLCNKYLHVNSEDKYQLYNYIINAHLGLKEHKKAEILVQEALAEFPNSDIFYNMYARIYIQRLNYKKALVWIDKAIAKDSDDKYNFFIKALILNDSGDFKQAKKLILDVLEEYPEDVNYLYLYAIILSNLDDKKYKEILHQILKLDPHNADALHFLAQNKESMFSKSKGFLKALKLNPFDKDFQSSYKANKRDFWIFIFSLLLVLGEIYLAMVLKVDAKFIKAINAILILSLIHLSYYTFEALILAFLLIFANTSENLQEAFVGAFILSALALIFARYIKSSLVSSIDTLKDSLHFIKNSSKDEVKDELFSNVFYIIMFFIVALCFVELPKDLQVYQGYVILLLPIVELIKKRVFSLFLALHVGIVLMVFKAVSLMSFNLLEKIHFGFLGYALVCVYALFAVMIVKRSNV